MDWKTRVRTAFATASRTPDDEVLDELALHLRAMYDAARADGCSHDEADRRVTAQLDAWRTDASVLRHGPRRTRVLEVPSAVPSTRFAGLVQDVRYAARLLRRQARYTLLVVLTMALGIGATTVLFSVTYGVLIRALPWPNSDRLVVVKETRGGSPPRFNSFSNTAYLAWREEATSIEDIAAWSQRAVTLSGVGEPERIRITVASASLFPVLGARPLIGTFFEQKDELSPVAVLSESLWRDRFGGDPHVLGRVVHFDGLPHSIIGVLPGALAYPDRESRAWVPMRIPPSTGNSLSMFNAIAVLRPGVTAAQAAAEGTGRGRFAADTGLTTMAIFGNDGPIAISAQPMRDALTADVRRPLVIMLAAVGLLLITSTANVASLQLARATTRRREMAIRAALGASRARVTRQLLCESLMLGLAGGVAGFILAWLLDRLIPTLLPPDFPRLHDLGVDRAAAFLALALGVLSGVVFGLLPVLRVTRVNLVESLSEDGTAPVGAGIRSRTSRLRMLIMAGQVAIACVLLVGASLLGRSFMALLNADRGFDPSGILTTRLSLSAPGYSPERRHALLTGILDRLAALPGATAVAFTSELPLTPGGSTSAFTLRSSDADGGTVSVQASPRIVSAQCFSALGMRITAGRGFNESDLDASLPVVVVNHTFARRYLGQSPLGAKVPMGVGYQREGAEATVVGVVDDIRYLNAAVSSHPEMYFSYRQMRGRLTTPVATVLVRTSGDPRALGGALRAIVREADPGLVPEAVMTLEERLVTSLARPRLYAVLLGGFATLALVVAAVGLFGVLSYSVAQRSRELAVRAALGARQADIVRLVLRQGLGAAIAGLCAGLLGSLAVTRSISALLYGIRAHDALTYLIVPLVVVIAAAVACVAPALRAARVDPLSALRS